MVELFQQLLTRDKQMTQQTITAILLMSGLLSTIITLGLYTLDAAFSGGGKRRA